MKTPLLLTLFALVATGCGSGEPKAAESAATTTAPASNNVPVAATPEGKAAADAADATR